MPQQSRLSGVRIDRDPITQRRPTQARVVLPCRNVDPRAVPPHALTAEMVLALQRSVGNRAVRDMLTVQRGRLENTRKKLAKERKRRAWKKTRLWPEQSLKGRILEVTDKYLFRRKQRLGYIDMNKVASNFPAIDGIANGKFRQVKAYLHLGEKKLRPATVSRIVAQVDDLTDKCEIAARRLTANNGRLLRQLLRINAGKASTKGRRGKAPYAEVDTSAAARQKHQDVLPEPFRQLAAAQMKSHKADPDNFDFDQDGLADEIMNNMVVVVPDELVPAVTKAVAGRVTVEGGGFTSTQIKEQMDVEGYAPSKRGEDKDEDYVDT